MIAAEPPKNVKSNLRHAFTIHSVQGDTLQEAHRLFIDARHMFEVQHWYTALSRAQYLDQIFIVSESDCDDVDMGKFEHTKIYRIVNDTTDDCYVGHTTKGLEERFKGHRSLANTTGKRKRCSSEEILKCKSARIELLEEWPCASL